LAEGFGGGKSFGVGHEAGAHGHESVFFTTSVASGVEGEFAVADDELPTFFDGGGRWFFARFEEGFGFGEDPWVLHGGTANHGSVDSGGVAALFDNFCRGEVAVSYNGDFDGLGGFVDDVPVGFSSVGLGAGATVDGDGGDADAFEKLADVGGVDGVGVPADADFGGDGNLVADGFDNFGSGFGEEGAVFEERRAAVFGDDFVDGAAEVDVDEVGLLPVDDFLCRFSHPNTIGTKELNSNGALLVCEFGVFTSPMIGLHDAFSGDEFGDHDVGTEFFADRAEGDIGHACHRGEEEWELIVGKPRKHACGSLMFCRSGGNGWDASEFV